MRSIRLAHRAATGTALTLATGLALVTAPQVIVPEGAHAQILGPPPAAQPPGPMSSLGAPAPDSWRQTMAELRLTPRGQLVRKKHHAEVDATTADGRRVIVSFDPQGRIWEVEMEDHDKHRYGDGQPMDGQAAVAAAGRAGFQSPMLSELKKNHAVVRARTSKGETVDLHVDRGGVIYKQVWLRDMAWWR